MVLRNYCCFPIPAHSNAWFELPLVYIHLNALSYSHWLIRYLH